MAHGFIWWILVGMVAGWLTGKIMSGGGYGFFVDVIVGILGALAGGFVMEHLFGAAGSGGFFYTIFVAVVGAVLLTLLLRLLTRGSTRNL